MSKDYITYKAQDFLNDDFFVSSMSDADGGDKSFWNELLDRGAIDVDEYLEAVLVVENLQQSRRNLPQTTLDKLWQRIAYTRHAAVRRRLRFRRLAMAACLVLAAGTLLVVWKKNASKMEIPLPPPIVVDNQQKDITIVTGEGQLTIEGKSAELTYKSDGSLTVNNKPAIPSPETAKAKVAEPTVPTFARIIVPFGRRATLTLCDGSRLWLNAGTSVLYPSVFIGAKREIEVEGEIYAEIQHNEKQPFVVKTDSLSLTVLGTSFNLSAYRGDAFRRVVLVNGSVEVEHSSEHIRLKPNESYLRKNNQSRIEEVDVETYTSWREGILTFKDEPIEQILRKLARYYNVEIDLPGQPSGTICSGKLELKDSLSVIMNGLSQIASFNFGVTDNVYSVKYNKGNVKSY